MLCVKLSMGCQDGVCTRSAGNQTEGKGTLAWRVCVCGMCTSALYPAGYLLHHTLKTNQCQCVQIPLNFDSKIVLANTGQLEMGLFAIHLTHLNRWTCRFLYFSAAVRSLCSTQSTCRYYVGSRKTHNH